jgi:hypothetical protein
MPRVPATYESITCTRRARRAAHCLGRGLPSLARRTARLSLLAVQFAVLTSGCSGDKSLGRGLLAIDSGIGIDGASVCSNRAPSDAGSGIAQGLLAWYRCEPPADPASTVLADGSGHGNDGTLTSATSGATGASYGAGKVGQAVYFSAANKGYATLPGNLLASACEATVAAWVYVNNAADWQRVFDFGTPEADGTSKVYMYLTVQDQTNKYLHFAISLAGPFSGEQTMDGPVVTTKAWHHVAVVLGAAGGFLYLDGVQVGANAALTLRPADLPHPLDYLVGRSQWRIYDYFLDGNVDEFRIYDRALAPAEIQTLASGA